MIEKSKQKFNSLKNTSKVSNKQEKQEKEKSKIPFNGFTVNIPGKGRVAYEETTKIDKK